jgi:uncharacterized protein involved in exopolysaccharide biosynthesis
MSVETASLQRDEGLDLFEMWRLVWNRRWLIAGCALLCGVIAVVLALLAKPVYRAEVVITQVRDSGMGGGASISGQLGGLAALAGVNLATGSGPAQEAPAVLRSRHLVEEFIKRGNLVQELLPNHKNPTLWLAVMQFQRSVLDIREDKRNSTMTVAINWKDPRIAARWANDFVALANELVRQRALNDSNRNIEYLNKQLALTNVLELRRVMFNLIESETKTLMLANARREYAFTVVDPSVPPELRLSPRRRVMVTVGLFLGVFLGVAIVFGQNALTRRREAMAAGH